MNSAVKRVELLRLLLALGLSLGMVLVIILLISQQPMQAISSFLFGPLASLRRIGNVVELMIPLMFSGLAIMFLFKTGLFNLSAEGAIFSGAVVAAVMSLQLSSLPGWLNLIISLISAGLIGGIVCLIPGLLKVKFHANEIVTSLMLNFVCLNIGLFIMHGYFLDPLINSPYSYKLPQGVSLGRMVSGTRIHWGMVIAVVAIIISWLILERSVFGFKARLVGANARMAKYIGVTGPKIILLTQFFGGILAGFGGSIELFGMYTRFQYSGLTGYGWEGIPIAIIARHNPRNLPLAALFFAYLKIGADIMARQSDVPFEIVQIIHAVMLIFISAQALLSSYRKHLMLKELQAQDKAEEAANV